MTTSTPQATDFHEAVQHPSHAFTDPRLKQGSVATNPLGLPLALSGGFALIYIVTVSRKKYAVRCFHRYVPNIEAKYAAISRALKNIRGKYFVGFDFQSKGIVVKQQVCPLVLMDWVEGPTLGNYLDSVYSDKGAVGRLRKAFHRLDTYLAANHLAHGDIQNGNVLVLHDQLVLIDYDGLYVDSLGRGQGTEIGHKHFQHPGRTAANFGPEIDRFSFIAVDVSLQALQADPSLYPRYREGGETIIFKANDYADPSNSEVFKRILSIPDTKIVAERFANVCRAPYLSVPTLTDFLGGRNIPAASSLVISAAPKGPRIPSVAPKPRYIGAYTIVNAANYSAGLAQVGNRVELIGQIVEVNCSVTRYRRRPFVFVNFGDGRSNIIKLTIWSEGLARFSSAPGKAWVAKWVSVVGLLDPSYSNKQYGYTHLSITVADPGQIQFIDESEARFRLGSAQDESKRTDAEESRWRVDGRPRAVSAGSTASKTHNEAVLERIRAAASSRSAPQPSATLQYPHYQSQRTRRQSAVRKEFNWGCLFWAVVVIVALVMALSK